MISAEFLRVLTHVSLRWRASKITACNETQTQPNFMQESRSLLVPTSIRNGTRCLHGKLLQAGLSHLVRKKRGCAKLSKKLTVFLSITRNIELCTRRTLRPSLDGLWSHPLTHVPWSALADSFELGVYREIQVLRLHKGHGCIRELTIPVVSMR